MSEQNALTKLAKAEAWLAEAKTLDDLKQIHDIAAAAQAYAKARDLGAAAEAHALEIRMVAARRIGELVPARPPDDRGQGRGGNQSEERTDLDIPKQRLSEFRKLAEVTETELRQAVQKLAEHEDVRLSWAGAVRAASLGGAVIPESTGDEYWTPSVYIESARKVMGRIDLDPASCEQANKTVMATAFFTAADHGEDRPWHGRVWMNPPYSANKAFAEKMLDEYEAGNVEQAVILLGAHAIETKWFAPYWNYVLCFTAGRIRFDTPTGPAVAGNINGSVFVYLGNNQLGFAKEFRQHGYPVKLWPEEA